MKIERREIQRSGRDINVAWINTEGIDLGIDTFSSGSMGDEVHEPEFIARRALDGPPTSDDDDDDVQIDLTDEDLQPVMSNDGALDLDRLYFCIDTYKKLHVDPVETWDALMRPANGFLRDGLSQGDARLLCLFFIDARRVIDEELICLRGNLAEVSNRIGNMLFDLSAQIDLPNKLIYYCQNFDIPIPDLSYAGIRVGQDREEMTFREPEYYRLMAISILCKILAPIWGDLTYRTIKTIDTMQKETHCVGVIIPILGTELFAAVNNKLYNYIASIVNTAISSSYTNAAFTATMGGFSQGKFHDAVYAMFLVKKYVNVDLYTEGGNLMVWTSTGAKQSFSSLLGTLNKKCHVMKRVDISDGPERGDEESNVSVLEHSSRVTSVTADVPILIKVGVRLAIQRICREYHIPDIELRAAMSYYQQNPIQVTFLNKILVSSLIGSRIGGAQGLKYLSHLDYTQLVAITQIYVANHIHSSLVHLLTASTPEELKTTPNTTDTRIGMVFAQTGEFQDCEKKFSYPIDNISIGGILLKAKDYVTKFNHFANTAPNVSTIMDEEPLAFGSLVVYDELIMRNFCSIILQILAKENQLLEV